MTSLTTEIELNKLVSTAVTSSKEAEDGDIAEEERAVDVLRVLQRTPVTAELLVKTEAGKKIKRLCKHASTKISVASSAVVEAWRDAVRAQSTTVKALLSTTSSVSLQPVCNTASTENPITIATSSAQSHISLQVGLANTITNVLPSALLPSPSQTMSRANSLTSSRSTQQPASTPLSPPLHSSFSQPAPRLHSGSSGSFAAHAPLQSPSQQAAAASSKPAAPMKPLRPAKTGDTTRDKIRMNIAEALAVALDDSMPDCDPCIAAVAVEIAMYKQNGGVNANYKAKYRSLAFNIKDPNNPGLRVKVLLQQIPADVLVEMSAEDMASDARRDSNDNIRAEMKKECERGQATQASCDMFQCGKCKQKKTTYYQLQTRSADEPMTTFVQCVVCSHRWKFC